MGFGPNRILSLPDGLARLLAAYLGGSLETSPTDALASGAGQLPLSFGDLCPECGAPEVVNEEGCRKCYSCGYSEC